MNMERKLYWMRFVFMIFLHQYLHMATSQLPEELQFPLLQKLTPHRYEVTIQHNIDASVPNYSGEVKIEVYCEARTETVSFHLAGSVTIDAVEVKLSSNNGNSHFTILRNNHFPGNQQEFTLDKPLEANENYKITIRFSNIFAFVGTGYIFKTYEKEGFADPKVMTFTKLNEFDARKVIPSLDQINLKAKFKIWLIHPKRLKGFSNARLRSSTEMDDKPGWVKDEFLITENMAPFSIAMALLECETTGLDPSTNVNVRTWADADVIHQMSYINELASKSVKFFKKLFKKDHPLKKLDILILPNVDFEVEESFGLIFMSQQYVLDILEKSSNPATYAMVTKICHAVSYQWIGSSVTMSKWEDNWLHQGLNHFLQEQCAQKIFPEYESNILEWNKIESFIAFMRSEEIGEYDQPITILKSYPNLDFIKYRHVTIEKVYHLMQMIYFMLGPELFNKSLVIYTTDYAGINSELDDALDVFTKRANSVTPRIFQFHYFTVQSIIKTWVYQTGAPLIIVNRDFTTSEIVVRQIIFNSLDVDAGYKDYINEPGYWIIPLSCTTERELKFDVVSPRVWLENSEIRWSPPGGFDKNDWILCNLEFNVPGRVLYDHKNWNLIHEFFVYPVTNKFEKISVLTRARLVSDMFTLAAAGEISYEIVLKTMTYLPYEKDFIPWCVALKEFDVIRSRLLGYDLDLLQKYQKFVRGILEPAFKKQVVEKLYTTYPTEDTLEGHFQILLMEISCKFDLEACLQKSSELNSIWNRSSNQGKELKIRHRLYKVVLCEQIKHGNEDRWYTFLESYYREERRSFKEDLLQALACSQKTEDLQRLLEQSINDPRISREDSIIIFQSLSSNKKGYPLMKKFFIDSHERINSFHLEGEPSKFTYLRILLDATNRRRDRDEIVRFVISNYDLPNDKLTKRSMNNARRNITWVHRNKKELKRSLSDSVLKKLWDKLKNKFKSN